MTPDKMQTVDVLAREVLSELSPQELLLFEITRDAFWKANGKLPSQGGTAGLNWDIMPGLIIAIAPVALALGNFALSLLGDMLREVGTEAAKDAYTSIRSRINGGSAHLPQLPGMEYDRLRTQIEAEAKRHLSIKHTEELTTAIMNHIARRTDEPR